MCIGACVCGCECVCVCVCVCVRAHMFVCLHLYHALLFQFSFNCSFEPLFTVNSIFDGLNIRPFSPIEIHFQSISSLMVENLLAGVLF